MIIIQTKSQPITRVMVWKAYKKVRANKGSGGVDEMRWEDVDKDLNAHLYRLWNRLTSGSYFPMPVREVEIKKDAGAGVRKLGIPTILNRTRTRGGENSFGTFRRTAVS